jgi:rhamnulokinase
VRETQEVRRYEPSGGGDWDAAEARLVKP